MMTRRLVPLCLFLILLLVPFGSSFAAWLVLPATAADGSAATLALDPEPLKTMTPIKVRLVPQNGTALSAVCDLTMPAMPMPENRPVLACDADGCSGEFLFTMAGAWEAECSVTFSDDAVRRYVFGIDQVLMK